MQYLELVKTVYIVIKILRENKRRKEILERGLR